MIYVLAYVVFALARLHLIQATARLTGSIFRTWGGYGNTSHVVPFVTCLRRFLHKAYNNVGCCTVLTTYTYRMATLQIKPSILPLSSQVKGNLTCGFIINLSLFRVSALPPILFFDMYKLKCSNQDLPRGNIVSKLFLCHHESEDPIGIYPVQWW